VEIIDNEYNIVKIKCWGVNNKKDILYIDCPYMICPDYNEKWGLSTKGNVNKSWKLLNCL